MPDDRVTQLGRVAVAALAAVLREDDPPPRTRLSPGRAVAVGAVVGTLGRVAAQREGFDRDEYAPAVGRCRGPGLERGRSPRGWKADVR
jgi:hypothetical protein